MKKNVFLGVDEFGRCCILKSIADFDEICKNATDISEDDFVHSCTNWGGCDDIQRTLDIEGLELTRRMLKLPEKMIFVGEDYDHGRLLPYEWRFAVEYIYETKSKE